MARSFLNPDTQILGNQTHDDTLGSGVTLETGAVSLEDNLNGIISQVKNILGSTNWYDAPASSLTQLDTDVVGLQEKPFLCATQVLTNITVGAGQNYQVLSVAGSEAPTVTAGVSGGNGAVVSVLGAGVLGTHSLDAEAGSNAVSPRNLVFVRDAVTEDAITSDGQQVYGLLQAENGVVQGDTFDDTSKRVQISFVKKNDDVLVAVPSADIAGKTIEYIYQNRVYFTALPEDCNMLNANFLDNSALVDITLQEALDNQTTPVAQTNTIEHKISENEYYEFQDEFGNQLMRINSSAGGDSVTFNGDYFFVNSSLGAQFLGRGDFNSGVAPVSVGAPQGDLYKQIGDLLVEATFGGIKLNTGVEIVFSDGNKSSSTFTGDFKLTETQSDWDNYEAKFGEVSLLNAVVQSATVNRTDYLVTSLISADTDFDPGANATVINGSVQDLSSSVFVNDIDIYVNGQLLINGADASANNDVYPGTDLTNSELKFEFPLRSGAHVSIVKRD
jgi:hypothetical protein